MQHVTSFTVETTLNNICFYSEWKNKAVWFLFIVK